ncbi:MAG: hydrogenase maturation nickel metallochaperone HypA [Gammaproteobacteria bacterium]|nr:hydrogenase maturation nickel metallochaperone HypA [Gammaproteobacteria bacterium]MDH5346200.1 hydrogenase maturation nickel metallochaperone HypA [Gammaproteobacteria bacterium]
MHELSVCQALLDEVTAIARRHAAMAVTDIHVGIGPLSGVEAALMRDAFPIAAAGTMADGAALYLRETAVRVKCTECGVESAARANRLVCGACGTWRTTLSGGDELLLERVGMQTDTGRAISGETAYV